MSDSHAVSSKVALITGASRGFGFACAKALGQTHHIIAVARTLGGLEDLDDALQEEAGRNATLVPLDLADSAGLARACAAIYERFGGLDVWLHSAINAPPLAPANHIAAADLTKTISLGAEVTADLISKIDPLLRLRNGKALYVKDAHIGQKFFGTYAAAKAAEAALFENWRHETQSLGLDVIAVSPRPMATALRARFFPGEDRAKLSTPHEEARRALSVIFD